MEPGLVSYALFSVGFLLALVLAYFGNAINQLLSIRIQRPVIQLKSGGEIPAYLKKLYTDATNQLTPLGFKLQHCQVSQEFFVQSSSLKWSLVMIHPATKVLAEISPASSAMDMPGYEVNFWSIAPDGNSLLTMNGRGHTVLSEIPGVTVHDPSAQSLHQQYDYHLEERKEWSSSSNYQAINAASYIKQQQKMFDGYIDNLARERGIVSTGKNQYRLSLLKCLMIAVKYIKGERQARKLAKTRFKLKYKNKLTGTGSIAMPSAQYPLESDVLSYKRLAVMRQRHLTGLPVKIALLVTTLLVTYLVLNLPFSYHSLLLLLAVVLLHELGHFIPMLLFRYRDPQIFCVPLLGTASAARNESIPVWKQLIIVTMGPFPGIIIGFFLLLLYQQDQVAWIYEAAILMLLVNYLHMLPFTSLDGGRIMRLAVMVHWPTGKILIATLIAAAFAATAYYFGEPVFWALAMLLVASIPFGIREISVLRELRKQLNSKSGNTPKQKDFYNQDFNKKLARMFLVLKNPKYRKLDFLSKFQVVKSLNGVISPTIRSNVLVSCGFLIVYLGTITAVPQTALLVSQGNNQSTSSKSNITGKVAKTDIESRIANAKSPKTRFELLLQATTTALEAGDTDKAVKYLEQAELSYGNINTDQALARLFQKYSVYHQYTGEFDEAAQYQNKAIALFEKTPKKSNYELATSYQNLATIRLKQGKNGLSEMNLQKALSFAVQINQPEHWKTITDISGELLDWYYHEGRQQEAVKLMDTLKSRFLERDEALQSYISMFIYEELGWLHAAANNEKAALEKFDNALQLAEKIPPSTQGNIPGRQQETRIILSKAAVYYKEGYTDFSKIQFDNAESLAREDSFRSLDQYIQKFSPKISAAELRKNQHREIRRWKLITDAFNKVRS